MKMKLTSIVVAIATCALVSAAPPKGDEKGKGKGKGRTERPDPTEKQKAARKEAMEERKAKWDNMSDADKAKLKADMEQRKAKWDALPEEKRKAKMDQMKAQLGLNDSN